MSQAFVLYGLPALIMVLGGAVTAAVKWHYDRPAQKAARERAVGR